MNYDTEAIVAVLVAAVEQIDDMTSFGSKMLGLASPSRSRRHCDAGSGSRDADTRLPDA